MTPKLLFPRFLNVLQSTLVPWLWPPGVHASHARWITVLQEAARGVPISCSGRFLSALSREKRGAVGAHSEGIAAGHAPEAGREALLKGKGLKVKPGARSPLMQTPQSSCRWSAFLWRGWNLHCREFGPHASPDYISTAVAVIANPFTHHLLCFGLLHNLITFNSKKLRAWTV